MRLSRLCLVLAALAGLAGEASAQGFFESLFGVRPPPQPPVVVPQPLPGGPAGPALEGAPERAAPAAPPPLKPIVLKAPTEEGVLGRELKLNGSTGSMRIDRAGPDLKARMTLAGTKASQPTQACTVQVGEGEPAPLSSQGRPDGVARYELQASLACTLQLDVLDGAVLVGGPANACTFEAADCRVDPRCLWGPEPASLLAKARDSEGARGAGDPAVRKNYRVMTHRAKPEGMRAIVTEQATFPSERETLCRSYAREAGHVFCNARFTEARALLLASRLGILLPPATGQAQAAPPPRRRRPAQTDAEMATPAVAQ